MLLVVLWIGGIFSVGKTYGTAVLLGLVNQTANQFFSTWGAFFTSIYLLARWFAASITTTDWLMLCATSAALFGSASSLHDNDVPIWTRDFQYQCENSTQFDCERVNSTRILGLVSLLTALLMGVISLIPRRNLLFIPNILTGTGLVVVWCIGIGGCFCFASTL